MKMHKYFLVVPFVFLTLLLMAFVKNNQFADKLDHYSGSDDSSNLRNTNLPVGYNTLFAGSGTCAACHNSMVNSQGKSVAIANDWRPAMMANSGKDPLWQAKVSHEGLVNPAHKVVLENVCTTCHAPVGNFNAHHSGQTYYSMAEMNADPLALDGVQCTVYHQITASSLGNFSGTFEIGTNKTIWGPFANPFANPMVFNTGYTPAQGNQINDSRLCGACHTLLTNSVDLYGVPTGEMFVEQAIFQEWANSSFSQTGATCQSCHVPRINDPVKISTVPPWLQPRSPFGMHQLAGANVFMGNLLKENSEAIGVTAITSQFDSTINRSTRMLQQKTLVLSVKEKQRTNDSLFVEVSLINKAGHKFPSGFPSRRAFVQFLATAENGDTLFMSGKTDENFNLIHEDEEFEQHHQIINSDQQVQIYEMVMGDVNGNKTTVLERGFQHLKDNRLPPKGFVTSHLNYDTVHIVGSATNDPDFNEENGLEGTGSDRLHYHIPLHQYFGQIEISVKVCYQTVNDKWLAEMFAISSAAIDAFKTFYDDADKNPILVAQKSLTIAAGYEIPFSQGWNSFSSFINPENTDIDTVLKPIIEKLIILVGEDGMIFPAGGIHTIENFDPYQGYSIKLQSPGILQIRGNTLISKQKPLLAGWNFLPALAGCQTPVGNLNSNFLNNLEIIVELAGWKVYWPKKQVYSLTLLTPGKAYMVKMKNPALVVFPGCD
jgi:hypothetical protein